MDNLDAEEVKKSFEVFYTHTPDGIKRGQLFTAEQVRVLMYGSYVGGYSDGLVFMTEALKKTISTI